MDRIGSEYHRPREPGGGVAGSLGPLHLQRLPAYPQ